MRPGPHQVLKLISFAIRALSPEGKSFSYDVKASGYGRGEGGACLIVKRLDDAIKSGDPIHAVINNTVCNHSGRSDGGITMPRQLSQQDLLLRVHHEVGLDPADTPVIEVSWRLAWPFPPSLSFFKSKTPTNPSIHRAMELEPRLGR